MDNNKRASIPATTTNSDNKKQKIVSTSATATSIFSSTAATASAIVTAKATATDNIDELKSENTRLQELVATLEKSLATKEGELATKEAECQCLRDENKLLKGRASSSSSVAAASVKEGPAATIAATVEQLLSIPSVMALSPAPTLAPATTAVNTCISSSAVADVMVEEDIHNGILSKILEYVVATTTSRRRNDNNNDYDDDDKSETVMPAGTTTTIQDELITLTLVSKRFHRMDQRVVLFYGAVLFRRTFSNARHRAKHQKL